MFQILGRFLSYLVSINKDLFTFVKVKLVFAINDSCKFESKILKCFFMQYFVDVFGQYGGSAEYFCFVVPKYNIN